MSNGHSSSHSSQPHGSGSSNCPGSGRAAAGSSRDWGPEEEAPPVVYGPGLEASPMRRVRCHQQGCRTFRRKVTLSVRCNLLADTMAAESTACDTVDSTAADPTARDTAESTAADSTA